MSSTSTIVIAISVERVAERRPRSVGSPTQDTLEGRLHSESDSDQSRANTQLAVQLTHPRRGLPWTS